MAGARSSEPTAMVPTITATTRRGEAGEEPDEEGHHRHGEERVADALAEGGGMRATWARGPGRGRRAGRGRAGRSSRQPACLIEHGPQTGGP